MQRGRRSWGIYRVYSPNRKPSKRVFDERLLQSESTMHHRTLHDGTRKNGAARKQDLMALEVNKGYPEFRSLLLIVS